MTHHFAQLLQPEPGLYLAACEEMARAVEGKLPDVCAALQIIPALLPEIVCVERTTGLCRPDEFVVVRLEPGAKHVAQRLGYVDASRTSRALRHADASAPVCTLMHLYDTGIKVYIHSTQAAGFRNPKTRIDERHHQRVIP